MDVHGLYADYAFSLLTYAFALSNLAVITVNSVGKYEQDRAITDVDRRAREEKLNVALQFLCRASGIFTYLSDTVLPEWETSRTTSPSVQRPPDLSREVSNALAKFVRASRSKQVSRANFFSRLSLADAQTLAIRRLLSKSAYDSNVSPGPPLPPSHRPPPLLAKLHIECAAYYSSARSLAMAPSKEVAANLRKYLINHATLHSALSHKWLGVDAGEKGGAEKAGDAVAFMQWAKKELEELKDGGKLVSIGSAEKDKEERWKERINNELSSVVSFLKYYKKTNDTVRSSLRFDKGKNSTDVLIPRCISNLFRHSKTFNLASQMESLPLQQSLTPLPHLLLGPDRSNTHGGRPSSLRSQKVPQQITPQQTWILGCLRHLPSLPQTMQGRDHTFNIHRTVVYVLC